jgi:hypothetical protein
MVAIKRYETPQNYTRRTIFGLAAGYALYRARSAYASHSIVAGAIRWDAWAALDTIAIDSVSATLRPTEYRKRAPFCATIQSGDQIDLARCASQTTMDAEITYAAEAGLNYWAYCWYGATDPMMNAWKLHQASSDRNRMNWCLLLQFARMGGPIAFNGVVSTYVEYFLQVNYQKVLFGRPLIYIYFDQMSHLESNWNGDWANVRTALDGLRAACAKKDLPMPYIVIMNGSPSVASSVMYAVAGDAIGNYIGPVPNGEPAPYSALDSSTQTYWARQAATGASIVPICMTGWDTRPRKLHPPLWQKNTTPGIGMSSYVAAGTPAEIATHALAAITYIKTHPKTCPSRSLLIYSWDECDEGGSTLVPTYSLTGPDNAILNAVGNILQKH